MDRASHAILNLAAYLRSSLLADSCASLAEFAAAVPSIRCVAIAEPYLATPSTITGTPLRIRHTLNAFRRFGDEFVEPSHRSSRRTDRQTTLPFLQQLARGAAVSDAIASLYIIDSVIVRFTHAIAQRFDFVIDLRDLVASISSPLSRTSRRCPEHRQERSPPLHCRIIPASNASSTRSAAYRASADASLRIRRMSLPLCSRLSVAAVA
jgi:hypothetical protein